MAKQTLKREALYTPCDVKQFTFASTSELPDLEQVIGQDRAVEAIQFGINIRQEGYNLYALGQSRSGKHSVVTSYIEKQALSEAVPNDWCYVNNFHEPHKPNALSLPAGTGNRFQKDMVQLVEELRSAVPAVLESDEYRVRLQEIEDELKERQEQAFEVLHKEASEHSITMLRTPTGFVFAPSKAGEVIKSKEFQKLSKRERNKIEETIANLQDRLEILIQQAPKWRRETQQQIKKLNRDVIMAAVGQLIGELRGEYMDLPEVLAYFDEVKQDVIDNADQFRQPEEGEMVLSGFLMPGAEQSKNVLKRCRVNVLVDHSQSTGAPIVYLDNPTYTNLVGRVEHEAQLGALVTDFTMIKAGALHEANGGYLILDALKILQQPYAWEGIKRVLRSRKIRIESLGQMLSLISTVSLEPEAIPLDIKVVLLGERLLYYLLCEYDPEFNELFKVAADFDDMIVRSKENDQRYASFIATLARRDNLHPLDAGAVARVIEYSSRMIEDAERLTSRFGKVADFLREADYWAGQAGHDVVQADDVQQTIDAHNRRLSRIRERLQEETLRGTLVIDTAGEQVGQINGLSVMQFGDYAFGHPSRITARVRVGKGDVVDIEREIEMGGPIHSKGVLILSGFLSGRYCPDQSLSLAASLGFEQTYGGVEGDSASSAELYTLLSALAEKPIKQSLAVTGSVNQLGQIQAIGGVNEKIEGFFDICQARGLDGQQGVLIPAANVKHLMLRKDIVDSVADNKFYVHAVETVDDGIEILTGIPAGERDAEGNFPEGSINQLVEAKLLFMAEQASKNEDKADK
ncbi:MAG: ATP-binding protein [Gammaproteobacteria bacterium]|nr:MAG: ATP-binding protein [Gammaproteobacteria bacterium]